jgi:hypothetical protein
VVLPFAFGVSAPVTLPSVVGIVLAGVMAWRGYRWAWGVLVLLVCVSFAVAALVTWFHPDSATAGAAVLCGASLVLLFSSGVLRYLDRWEATRSQPFSVG